MDNNIKKLPFWINGKKILPQDLSFFVKKNPHNSKSLYKVPIANKDILHETIVKAKKGFEVWSNLSSIERGKILFNFIEIIKSNKVTLIKIIKNETGKSNIDALVEFNAAINQGEFFASEGYRLNGETLNSSLSNKTTYTIKAPHGIVGLIISANTPIANIAWKIFPALITGNAVILKSSEDAPYLAYLIGQLSKQAGLPPGVINIVHGDNTTGELITTNMDIKFISFTGSTDVGKKILKNCVKNLTRVSLELGGNNSLYVSENADIQNAIEWVMKSSFSNAGQRCAGLTRLILNNKIYNIFIEKFISSAKKIKLGITDDSFYGPLISEKQLNKIIDQVNILKAHGYKLYLGGKKSMKKNLKSGYYFEPTILEYCSGSKIFDEEIFGPVVTIFKVNNITEALTIANKTKYGLTSSIHSDSINEAMFFIKNIRTGVVNVNIGTHGSEPHYPFGGFGNSGNGSREPGKNAVDLYTELKVISIKHV
jgi:acyl-CoA reductase-like NAD-dependent aldehyde dehydrogenase